MADEVTRLQPGTRRFLQVGGIGLFGIGIILALSGFASFASFEPGMSGVGDGPSLAPMFVGGVLAVAGSGMMRFGFLKPVSEIAATETAGAVQVTGAAVARGIKEGLGGGLPGATVVKVRCRACGFLDSEDARFCSNCRAAM